MNVAYLKVYISQQKPSMLEKQHSLLEEGGKRAYPVCNNMYTLYATSPLADSGTITVSGTKLFCLPQPEELSSQSRALKATKTKAERESYTLCNPVFHSQVSVLHNRVVLIETKLILKCILSDQYHIFFKKRKPHHYHRLILFWINSATLWSQTTDYM